MGVEDGKEKGMNSRQIWRERGGKQRDERLKGFGGSRELGMIGLELSKVVHA
ncbi:hypothetical protein U1Q18_005617, partial [Sarracenia purpurea var. burkii]